MVVKKAAAKKIAGAAQRPGDGVRGKPGSGTKPTDFQAKKRATRLSAIKNQLAAGNPAPERARIYLGKTNTNILVGKNDVSDWTEEELEMGRRQSKAGTFSGRPPLVVPKAVHDELVKRTLNNAQEHMRQNLEGVVQVLVEIAAGPGIEPKDRLKAISMIMDRVMGKVPDTVNMKADAPWVQAITDGIVPRAPIVVRSREAARDEDYEEDD